jgi:hypothetical protein
MKARVNLDKRCEMDKQWDKLWNEMVRSASLNARQSTIVGHYLRRLMGMRIHEVESARDMSWIAALVEREGFGTDVSRGATRIIRAQQYACDVCNEAYGKECINANGRIEYDGCGLEHLKNRLAKYNVEYDTDL